MSLTGKFVLQAAVFKVYGRINGPLSDHAPLFVESAWAVMIGPKA